MTESLSPREMAAALGQPFWTSSLFMPIYKAGTFGNWRIQLGGQLINDWGYFTQTNMLEMLPYLSRRVEQNEDGTRGGWEVWMSLTPHEIESQELGCLHAFGHTVIMGLGMGWIAANVALNPAVTRVTIIERDPAVLELYEHSGALDSLPVDARAKIELIHADALHWRPEPSKPVDFLFVDIWLQLAEPDTLKEVRQMQAHVQADRIYYWGQEIGIYCAGRTFLGAEEVLTAENVRRAVDDVIQLPLLIPEDCDYAELIERAIQNRKTRQLVIETNVL